VKPTQIHHVAINVSDVARSLPFYVEVLGLAPRSDRPDFAVDGAWLSLGPSQVHLVELPVPPVMGQHFAIGVEDLDDAITHLRSAGVAVDGPHPIAGQRQAFLADPDGNVIELQGG
jgi:catechol 2,3-dioxygenase-like lactoylglutathione lyase family enzyme